MKTNTSFNYFDNATVVENSKSKTTKDKNKVFVTGIEKDLLRKAELKIEASNIKTEDTMVSGRIKEIARKEILKLYSLHKARPESFKLCDGKGEIMVILKDAYKTVEEAKIEALKPFPGVLATSTVYTFNPEIFAKPGVAQALSKAISSCKDISDDDKKKLILKEEVTTIKKGTVDRLLSFDNYEQLFSIIDPTIDLK